MKMYFVTYTLITYQYMEDGRGKESRTILVEAESEAKAKETLEKYWENKSDSYSTSYGVQDVCVIPTIKQVDILK